MSEHLSPEGVRPCNLRCSHPFFTQQPEERTRLHDELEEAKDKARRRSIGNIKFIGELFKLKMLTEAIMHDCVVKLLKNHDEESLECLCRLLTTIGKDLDFEKAKVPSRNSEDSPREPSPVNPSSLCAESSHLLIACVTNCAPHIVLALRGGTP